MTEIWTEKYRPKEFSEIKGQDEIVTKVKAFVEKGNMPHLLFAGPAGTGKSSLSLVIVKSLYKEKWRENYLELNASDERGIDIIRQKVKDFARTKSLSENFKIIFLDEADALTREAQQALRRTMENFTKTCRFILSCNYSTKIIEPIQSRCVVFRFQRLDKTSAIEILKNISEKENLQIDAKALETLYDVSEGDCRRMINILQACSDTKLINEEKIYSVVKSAQPSEIRNILMSALSGNFIFSRERLLDLMLKQSLSGLDLIKTIQKEIPNLEIDEKIKLRLIEKCGEIEFRLVEGSDEFIQLEALLASFVLMGIKK
ncbi:MAG: replication factor C small subunit [Candidatus Pacearchaeota archaeon]